MKNFRYDESHALLPSDVAERMVELCQQAKFTGGTVFETNVTGDRIIPEVGYFLQLQSFARLLCYRDSALYPDSVNIWQPTTAGVPVFVR